MGIQKMVTHFVHLYATEDTVSINEAEKEKLLRLNLLTTRMEYSNNISTSEMLDLFLEKSSEILTKRLL